jgi:hypothetical protein
MTVSFDGLRKNATRSMNTLHLKLDNILKAYGDDIYESDKEELIEAYNQAARFVDSFNCLFDPDNEADMSNLSDILHVKRLDEEDYQLKE